MAWEAQGEPMAPLADENAPLPDAESVAALAGSATGSRNTEVR
jgi:hypothetical protein